MKNYGIILGSGTGSRYGSSIPKQFTEISGKTILEHTVEIFEKSEYIDGIIVVIPNEYIEKTANIIKKNQYKKIVKITAGGETRTQSSSNGVNSLEDAEANVLIHDCARPLLSGRIIIDCVKALKKYKAVAVGSPSSDTIIKVKNNIIEEIPKRNELKRIQTPQCFKLSLIKEAHKLAKSDTAVYTDDCGIVLHYNLCDIFVVEGDTNNIKITYPEDFYFAEKYLENHKK